MFKILSNINFRNGAGKEFPDIECQFIKSKYNNLLLDTILLFYKSSKYDAIVLNCGGAQLLMLSVLKRVVPNYNAKIIAVEWNGVKPTTFMQSIKTYLAKKSLNSVDLFLLLIKDISSFEKYFGIGKDRVEYIPFKINNYEENQATDPKEQNYILTCGNRRDYNLVYDAIKDLNYPAKFIRPPEFMIKSQGTKFLDHKEYPKNIEIILHDGSYKSWIKYIAQCKILVVPVDDRCIYAEGCSTYIEAMALKKCVITTKFEGTNGIIDTGEAILIPRKDVNQLKAEIIKAWEDDDYRQKITERGYNYAMSLGGKDQYHRNILHFVNKYLNSCSEISTCNELKRVQPE